ncbi:MAG: class I SAM-dependent RNA methyltransferase, partial [Oscillospiraceae bacterium]|nr:class I SAM-dependent RNA methyltransferase [Oscillospiraceae bacterium]
MEQLQFVIPCIFGVEGLLADELRRLDMSDVEAENGRVFFKGTVRDMARANLWVRTGERVLIVLDRFFARSFEQLFEGVRRINFEDFIGKNDAFPVKGWSIDSTLHSIPDCQSIIKKAVVRRLSSKYNITWFEETGASVPIRFSIMKDEVTIMLDTSGAGLHKRGYRANSNIAPIKETLAAAIVNLARVRDDTIVYDPFCGSGTLLIEAALKALNIAPGIRRKFISEDWGFVGADVYKSERLSAHELIKRDAKFKAYGSDISSEAIALTTDNAKKAGVISKISLKTAPVSDFHTEELRATILCNPPYGERMLDIKEAQQIYKTMSQIFEHRKFLNYYIITPDEEFEKIFG